MFVLTLAVIGWKLFGVQFEIVMGQYQFFNRYHINILLLSSNIASSSKVPPRITNVV